MLRRLGVIGALEEPRGLASCTDAVRSLFDGNLKDAPAAQLKDLASRYPEVQIKPRYARQVGCK